jgi:hypothetical protein
MNVKFNVAWWVLMQDVEIAAARNGVSRLGAVIYFLGTVVMTTEVSRRPLKTAFSNVTITGRPRRSGALYQNQALVIRNVLTPMMTWCEMTGSLVDDRGSEIHERTRED